MTVAPGLPLREHIRALWPALVRQPAPATSGASLLPLPRPYVVPGGRFRELYYWDSYFTLLGLRADGRGDLVEAMLDNFTTLIERHGHIPNGTRTYYLSRSQPPLFALMLDLSASRDRATRARRLAALRAEHAWWTRDEACARARGACGRTAQMPDGGLLARYWDDRATPRDESYAEDVATARAAAPRLAADTYRDLRAAAESGWDFSSRWLADPARLATIRTTAIVPVDLNSLLVMVETRIARRCAALGDRPCATAFAARAAVRAKAIRRWLWVPAENRFGDFDLVARRPTPALSAATLYPLWAGIATDPQARAVALTTRARLLAPGGLLTTPVATGQQWDRPNGWAPLQWIGVRAFADRDPALARDVAGRFLATVERTYRGTGKLLEKYDVETARAGGGGEYPTQDGFGWTNGVAAALLDERERALPYVSSR